MPISPQQHAVYRAALNVADSIDHTGRFRAILHLLRCAGAEQIDEILALRIGDVGGVLAASPLWEEHLHGYAELRLGGHAIALDEEAVAELRTYLRRQARHVRFRLFQRRERASLWYAHVICAGGHAIASLGTQDQVVARGRVRERRKDLARAARDSGPGLLFPAAWARHASVSIGQLRIWINAAVGRKAPQEIRVSCERARPVHRAHERRRRRKADAGIDTK